MQFAATGDQKLKMDLKLNKILTEHFTKTAITTNNIIYFVAHKTFLCNLVQFKNNCVAPDFGIYLSD